MSTSVNLFVVSPDTRSERRYDLHITVQQLKVRGFTICASGRPAEDLKLRPAIEQTRVGDRDTSAKPSDLCVQHRGRYRTCGSPR